MRAIVDVPVSAVEWWIASELDLPVVSYTALGTDRYPPFTLAESPTIRHGWISTTQCS